MLVTLCSAPLKTKCCPPVLIERKEGKAASTRLRDGGFKCFPALKKLGKDPGRALLFNYCCHVVCLGQHLSVTGIRDLVN